MPDPQPDRLRLTARSVVIAVALLGLTLAGLRMAASAGRVLLWVATATVIAGLLHPFVATLSRWLPRVVAAFLVAALSLAAIGVVAYRLVDDVVTEMHHLQDS